MSIGIQRSRSMLLLFVLAVLMGGFCSSQALVAEESLDELVRIQSQVRDTVSKVMPSVVAVTDGSGWGSGVVVSSDGLVLTAGHVMASPFSDRYEVVFPNGRRAKARPLGKNLNVDAGMVQIVDAGPFPFADVAKTQPELGNWVVTLGHSGGYDIGRKPPVRTGRVLSYRDHQLVTDAVLIGGDSGGPLFNLQGEVIAIHSSIGDSIAENRHVTVDTFEQHWTRMLSGESWGELPELESRKKRRAKKRARIGVVVDREAVAATVKKVHPNSPAANAGLIAGDVITRFDNQIVDDSDHLIKLVKRKQPGDQVGLEVLRDGFYFTIFISLEDF